LEDREKLQAPFHAFQRIPTECVLLRYYAKWIPSRQARLSAILQEAFADKPRPVAVKKPNFRPLLIAHDVSEFCLQLCAKLS
jgi:hypothetical protein